MFSSLRLDAVLNATVSNALWTSSAAPVVPNAWSYVAVPIAIAFPSTLELVFRADAAVSDTMSLKRIAIVDASMQTRVGDVQVVSTTGGMIALRVDTSDALAAPLVYRVEMRQQNMSLPAATAYAGTKLCERTLRVMMTEADTVVTMSLQVQRSRTKAAIPQRRSTRSQQAHQRRL